MDRQVAVAFAAERATAELAMPQLAGHRRLDHAEHRDAVVDQGDIDGELAIALDEFAGAVERIHQPHPRPLPAQRRRDLLRRFLPLGRASCRERGCTYVWISVGAVQLK